MLLLAGEPSGVVAAVMMAVVVFAYQTVCFIVALVAVGVLLLADK